MGGKRYVLVFAACAAGCGNVKSEQPDAGAPRGVDDAAPDAAHDGGASGPARFDVAYINDFTINPNIESLFSFALVINKGTAPLKLQTTTVVTFSDDSAAIDWSLTKTGASTATLRPGSAAGMLNPDASAALVDTGLVPEPVEDNTLNFTMDFAEPPPAGVTLKAQAVLKIETTDLVLPFTITIVASGAPKYNAASRLSSN